MKKLILISALLFSFNRWADVNLGYTAHSCSTLLSAYEEAQADERALLLVTIAYRSAIASYFTGINIGIGIVRVSNSLFLPFKDFTDVEDETAFLHTLNECKKDNSKYLNEILFPYYLKLPNAEE